MDDIDEVLAELTVREICAFSLFNCDGSTPEKYEKCKSCNGDKRYSCEDYIPIFQSKFKN